LFKSSLRRFSVEGIYIQIAVTIISIGVHLFNTRNTNRKESVIEIVTIYVIGLSGWFGIMSGLFGHILYADEVATSIGLGGFLSRWNKG
jgi:hypothetical protein